MATNSLAAAFPPRKLRRYKPASWSFVTVESLTNKSSLWQDSADVAPDATIPQLPSANWKSNGPNEFSIEAAKAACNAAFAG
jgi:hypothetical protein